MQLRVWANDKWGVICYAGDGVKSAVSWPWTGDAGEIPVSSLLTRLSGTKVEGKPVSQELLESRCVL